MTVISQAEPAERQDWPVAVAIAGLFVVAGLALEYGSTRRAVAVLIGGLAGFALYHAAFGFTSAWRRIVTERRSGGLQAQFLLIAVTCAISYPLLAYGSQWGVRAGGFVFPFGVSVAVGSFVFGMGMQLGGGCGSGTLFTAGGGSTRMMITLAAFVAGSLIGTAHVPAWNQLPRFEAVSLVKVWGPFTALAVTLAIMALFALATRWIEQKAHGGLEDMRPTLSFIRGPWSPWLGAIAIAVISIATILTLGRPWGVTSGFALWGAKIANMAGVSIETWPYWKGQMGAVERSVFADATSVMNFGILFGAMAAAGLASRYRPQWRIAPVQIATAVVGGLLMGYGARLAYGCNIGAYLGGIVSGSVHGWFWMIFAFTGSSLMAVLKPRMGIA